MYVAFLDAQKASDTVWRHSLMGKLHQLDVKGLLWILIDDCHRNILPRCRKSKKLRLVPNFSRCEARWSPFNIFVLSFHKRSPRKTTNQSPYTGIHSIRSSNPAPRDEVSCTALLPRGLQTLLNRAYDFSTRWQFFGEF